jgi:hypothetical protein
MSSKRTQRSERSERSEDRSEGRSGGRSEGRPEDRRREKGAQFLLKNLPYNCRDKQVMDLHPAIVYVSLRRGTALVTLAADSNPETFKTEIEGQKMDDRDIYISPWTPREKDRGDVPRGRGFDRRFQSRSRSRSSGPRDGPRGPRIFRFRGDHLLVKIPSVNAFLESFGYKSKEGALVHKQALVASWKFDPAIQEISDEQEPTENAVRVVRKRLFAVINDEGELLVKDKDVGTKVKDILDQTNLDSKNTLMFRFEGDAVLPTLVPLLNILGWFLNNEETPKPMMITSITSVTHLSLELPIVAVRKWTEEEDDEDEEAETE